MHITLYRFENNVSKYLKMALLIDVTVVDLETGRSWIITKGDNLNKKPRWNDLVSGVFQHPQPA